jgi:myo-inositol catabolism protein IolH
MHMKITFDTTVFWGTDLSFEEQYAMVADIGFKYISPYNKKFPGLIKRPKATKEDIAYHKKAIHAAGLTIASLTTGFRIADPDEFVRTAAIEHWKRMLDIAEELEVNTVNTELGGDINQPELCEEKLMQSLDVLVPILEKRGIRMDIQAHPFDFYETHEDAVDIISYYDSKSLGYLYSIPHTFFYDNGKGDIAGMLQYAGRHLKHILFADTYDHTRNPFRYNLNPPKAHARVHSHIGVGQGDVDWEACFKTLREMEFGKKEDTVACFNPLGFPEFAKRDGAAMIQRVTDELLKD